MTLPRITLITPSFNQGQFLEQTIQSVIDQHYPNLEYFVVDGGSTDSSLNVIKKYQESITWWVSEKDKGQAHAINKGLKRATGDIISWINSDDYLEKNALKNLAAGFNNPGVNCVIGKISYFKGNEKLWKSVNVVRQPAEKTLGSGVVPQPAMYFSKACYDHLGLLNENLNFCFDSEWYMRYLVHYGIDQIFEIPETVVNFRFHDDSKTMTSSLKFQEERGSIGYSIARQTGLNNLAMLLKELYRVDENYHFEMPVIKNGLSVEKAMNYLVLLLGDEFYAENKKALASKCFKVINEALLEKNDLSYYKKLKIKNSYLPLPLIKILRKIKQQ